MLILHHPGGFSDWVHPSRSISGLTESARFLKCIINIITAVAAEKVAAKHDQIAGQIVGDSAMSGKVHSSFWIVRVGKSSLKFTANYRTLHLALVDSHRSAADVETS
jgi:hypothetical protein